MFTRQNNAALPKRCRANEFKAMTDEEVISLEKIVRDVFEGFVGNQVFSPGI